MHCGGMQCFFLIVDQWFDRISFFVPRFVLGGGVRRLTLFLLE